MWAALFDATEMSHKISAEKSIGFDHLKATESLGRAVSGKSLGQKPVRWRGRSRRNSQYRLFLGQILAWGRRWQSLERSPG